MSQDEFGNLGSATVARRLRGQRRELQSPAHAGPVVPCADFVRQSLHFTIYIALVAGIGLWAIQRPAAKTAIKEKVAHARDKYVFDGDAGPTATRRRTCKHGLITSRPVFRRN